MMKKLLSAILAVSMLCLYIMEIFLHGARFDVFFIYSGKDISLSVGKFLLNELDQTVWNWNCTDRTFAFG